MKTILVKSAAFSQVLKYWFYWNIDENL